MSGKGNCYDNAQAESFFSRFKTELVMGGIFEDVETAQTESFSYIECYYNRKRRHSGIGYKIPMEFEQELKIKEERRKKVRKVSALTCPPHREFAKFASEKNCPLQRDSFFCFITDQLNFTIHFLSTFCVNSVKYTNSVEKQKTAKLNICSYL